MMMMVSVRPVRLAYQPPANSTFLSEQTSHQQPARTSQQYTSLRTNQHQPSATSQPNRLVVHRTKSLGIAAQVKMTVMMMVMVTMVVVMMMMVMVMVMMLVVVVVVEFISQVYTCTFTHTYDVSNYMC
jgi:uncharacterized membrane protein